MEAWWSTSWSGILVGHTSIPLLVFTVIGELHHPHNPLTGTTHICTHAYYSTKNELNHIVGDMHHDQDIQGLLGILV